MNEKEMLKKLIDKPKQPNLAEWVYAVEDFLVDTKEITPEASGYIKDLKSPQGDAFGKSANLIAILNRLNKRKYDSISLPPITKRNQIFVAMWFNDEMDKIYNEAYEPVIQSLNYAAMRIDRKEYNDSIMGEIYKEIPNSIALIADLTGNRGGVYHEAGIARGLKLCNHPIELIFTCQKECFDEPEKKPHFDVQGNKIIVYSDVDDLKRQLKSRLEGTLKGSGKIK